MAENDEIHPPAPQPKNEHSEEGHNKKERKKTILENIVDESWSLLKKTALVGAAVATPFVFSIPNTPIYNPQMSVNAAVTALPLSAGAMLDDVMAKKPVDYKKVFRESVIGTAITPPLTSFLGGITSTKDYVTRNYGTMAGNATAIASLAAGQGAFLGSYMGLDHILSKYSFKGIYEKLKKDYWPTLKRVWKYVLPFSMWNVLYVYKFGILAQLAYGSLMTLLFRVVGPKSEGASLGNLFRAMNPFPLMSATYNLGVKAVRNTFSSLYEGAYGLGAGIKSMFSALAPKSSPAVPKPAEPKPAEHPEGEHAPSPHYMKAPSEKSKLK